MIIRKKDKNFISIFNTETGFYVRSGIFVDGKETMEDPFMASFPELIDVGVMGSCIHGRSGLCMKAGIECYQDGLHKTNPNMTVEDFASLVKQCEGKTFQFALGGAGDPDMHENFEELLKICREHNIVPNFTTSGLGMTPEKAAICKKYCGAVAVSWYRSDYTLKAIQMLKDAGVKTNIHYVISDKTIDEAIDRLENVSFPDVNAVVFLLHKPIGLGTKENMIKIGDKRMEKFLKLIEERSFPFKIGFDSCTVPALINLEHINKDSLDTCEGGRWSCYITPDMKMLPCSFDNDKERWAVDLRTHTLKEAWDSETFEDFRNHFRNACPNCEKREFCRGGCPICPEIVLCGEKHE